MEHFLQYMGEFLPLLLSGAKNTLLLFVLTLICSLPFGLLITLGGISKIPPLRWAVNVYIWVFRGTPLMLQLFFMYFFLPIVTKQWIMMDKFSTAVITFILNYAAYFAEIYRGGIQSIDIGQYEAAKTIGLTRWQTMRHVIIPQTIRRVIPAVCNESITLSKDTALIYAIGVMEVLYYAKATVNRTSNPLAYVAAAVFYLIFTFVVTVVANKLERKFSKYER